MKTNTHGTTWRSARVLLAGAIATATMASGSAALASGDRNIAISGMRDNSGLHFTQASCS